MKNTQSALTEALRARERFDDLLSISCRHRERARARRHDKEESAFCAISDARDRRHKRAEFDHHMTAGTKKSGGLQGIRVLRVPPRLKDHMRCMLTGRIKCGSYWSNIREYTERAFCSFCKKKEGVQVLENENHLWLECENNGQSLAWELP
jgi:hypothetical protein